MGKQAKRPPSFSAMGPLSLADAKRFPHALVDALQMSAAGSECMARLAAVLNAGLLVSEDYAGLGTMSLALRLLHHACKRKGVVQDGLFGVHVHRASDRDPLCQAVLGANEGLCKWHRAAHIFGDILERLPAEVRDTLQVLQPEPTADPADAKHALQVMAEVLVANEDVFTAESHAHCVLHNKACPLNVSAESLHALLHQKLPHAEGMFDDEGVVLEQKRPWTINTAGHTCTGWSMRGRRAGMLHESGLPFLTWAAERRSRKEDVTFAECTPNFQVEEMRKAFPNHYRRHRVFNALLHPESVVWCGPPAEACQAVFESVFMRTTVLDAHELCVATEEESLAYMERVAQRRGKTLQGKRLADVDVTQILSPSAVRRYIAYENKMKAEACYSGGVQIVVTTLLALAGVIRLTYLCLACARVV